MGSGESVPSSNSEEDSGVEVLEFAWSSPIVPKNRKTNRLRNRTADLNCKDKAVDLKR